MAKYKWTPTLNDCVASFRRLAIVWRTTDGLLIFLLFFSCSGKLWNCRLAVTARKINWVEKVAGMRCFID